MAKTIAELLIAIVIYSVLNWIYGRELAIALLVFWVLIFNASWDR